MNNLIIALSATLLLVGCSEQSNTISIKDGKQLDPLSASTSSETATPAPVQQQEEKQWQSYSNARYGYAIRFPADWPLGSEAGNGGGAWLYVGNPDVNIVTFAYPTIPENNPFTMANEPGFKGSLFKLDNGKEAMMITGRQEGKIVYEVVADHGGFNYHLRADVSEEFFRENEKVLFQVAKSLTFP